MDGKYNKKLRLKKQIAIQHFQENFNRHYPFLRIEIAKKSLLNPVPFNKTTSNHSQPIDITTNHFNSSIINIEKDRTIAQLEKDFKDLFYLSAQVFRKSGNVWVETSLTDDWTLEHQNNEGEIISILLK